MANPIRLMHYDPRWPQEFQQTRSGVLHCCRGWVIDVQHIGSTAVSGMVARPVLDVVAAVGDDDHRDQALEESANLIEGLNYRRGDVPMWAADSMVLIKPRRGDATHRVFLTYLNSPFWKSSILIRDALSSNRELSLRFEETKVTRWRKGEGDPEKYASDKAVFFAHLLDQQHEGSNGQ